MESFQSGMELITLAHEDHDANIREKAAASQSAAPEVGAAAPESASESAAPDSTPE